MAASTSEQLKIIPWKNFMIRDDSFLVKFLLQDDAYEILMVNRLKGEGWYEKLCSAAMLQRSKEINSVIEMPVDKLMIQIKDLIEHSEDVTSKIRIISQDSLMVTASKPFSGLTFQWDFHLSSVRNNVVAEHLTEPLMLMNAELLRRQRALCNLLKNKDKELEDLKAQAVQLTRKRLETKPFNEESFNRERSSSPGRQELLEMEGDLFNSTVQDLYQNVTEFVSVRRTSMGQDSATSNKQTNSVSQSQQSTADNTANQSPVKRPAPAVDSTELELQRRQELERKLAEKDEKESKKKKKKLNL